MLVPLKDLGGCGPCPEHRSSLSRFMVKKGIEIIVSRDDGRKRELVNVADLPDNIRRAFLEKHIAAQGMAAGTYDDDAHAVFEEAPATMRAAALRKADMAVYLLSIRAHHGWPERLAMMREKFGEKGVTVPSLKRLLAKVKGVDPVNFAPALLAGYTCTATTAPISEEAIKALKTLYKKKGPEWPFLSAWKDIRDVKDQFGWDWPSYSTVRRWFNNLDTYERLLILHGEKKATDMLTVPQRRNKPGVMVALSLDGNTKDFWVELEDGVVARLTRLVLVDIGSNAVLGWRLCRSENAEDTAALILDVVRKYGVFDFLYTDNSRAFSSHIVAGGNFRKYRNGGSKRTPPPGVCQSLGIHIRFAKPGFSWSKLAERTFKDLTRQIDDRPEFHGAHAGHSPGNKPPGDVQPIPLAEAKRIIEREIERYNREPGRRAFGANGRSYQQVFEDGFKQRAKKVATKDQIEKASRVYVERSVNRDGQIQVGDWFYGQQDTVGTLMPFHERGERIFIGYDPNDHDAPAVAYTLKYKKICGDIKVAQRGEFFDDEGARNAGRNRNFVKTNMAKIQKAENFLADAKLAEVYAALDRDYPDAPPPQASKVAVMQPHAWHDNPPDATEGGAVPQHMMDKLYASAGIPRTGTGK